MENDNENKPGEDAKNGGEPDTFEVGQGAQSAAPVEAIGERLSKAEGASVAAGSDVAEAENALPFDISKLSKDQLQILKSMLAATPETLTRKKAKPRIKIRRIEGQFVVDFKNAYLGLVKDITLNRDVERHIIPIKYLGATEYTAIEYRKFIESEQVPCEVVSTRQDVDEIPDGETFSRETGAQVEMIKKIVHVWFTIKLPEGSPVETIEIEGKVANG